MLVVVDQGWTLVDGDWELWLKTLSLTHLIELPVAVDFTALMIGVKNRGLPPQLPFITCARLWIF